MTHNKRLNQGCRQDALFQVKLVLTATVLWAVPVAAQTTDPNRVHASGWSGTYDPVFRHFDAAQDNPWNPIRRIVSPFLTNSIRIIEESDTSETPYGDTQMKAVIFVDESPSVTIELNAYRNFEFKWINEEIVHLFSSPGRCVTVDTIYNLSEREIVYSAAFSHCGV